MKGHSCTLFLLETDTNRHIWFFYISASQVICSEKRMCIHVFNFYSWNTDTPPLCGWRGIADITWLITQVWPHSNWSCPCSISLLIMHFDVTVMSNCKVLIPGWYRAFLQDGHWFSNGILSKLCFIILDAGVANPLMGKEMYTLLRKLPLQPPQWQFLGPVRAMPDSTNIANLFWSCRNPPALCCVYH